MQTTYIFGHKKPDTDSVCSSICLSYLKNKLGENTEPRVLGDLNKETKFVLESFGFKEPEFLNDVKVQIKDMHYEKNARLEEHESIYKAYRYLMECGYTGLPLVNKKNELTGYVNVKEISKYLIDGDMNYLHTSYDNILATLSAKAILRFDNVIEGKIMAAAFKSETFIEQINLDNHDILIVGDRYKIMEYAVQSGIKLLILVNSMELPNELLEIAKKNKVNVVSVPLGTYKCANMVRLCNYVQMINVTETPISFSVYDYRNDFIDISNKYGHTNYPIVNKRNECLGMMRLIDQNDFERKKVILVDHNQSAQSVDGIEEAEIVEVVDHHNLGTIGTTAPINFRSMPVGCTCTLLYKLFQEANVEIPKNIAGLMLSAILSDTMLYKSPTTTELDVKTGEKLAEIAELDSYNYGIQMFKAASSIAGMSISDIVNSDIKSFRVDEDTSLSIGQVFTMDFEELSKKQDEIVSLLTTMKKMGNLKLVLLFVTDIIKNGSYLYYSEGADDFVMEAYDLKEVVQGIYLDGAVSRKKQMLPPMLETLERRG